MASFQHSIVNPRASSQCGQNLMLHQLSDMKITSSRHMGLWYCTEVYVQTYFTVNMCVFVMNFGALLNNILVISRRWKGEHERLCSEASFKFGKNLTNSGIETRDPVIQSRKR